VYVAVVYVAAVYIAVEQVAVVVVSTFPSSSRQASQPLSRDNK
jgi:hypothetical protein